MKEVAITGTLREDKGTSASNVLRNQGMVPCVIYGGEENVHFYADERVFKDLIYSAEVHKAVIDVNGNKYEAILKEAQFHPVKDNLLHVDFLELVPGKPVTTVAPVKLIGNAIGVRNGGKLSFPLRRLKVKATPENLPDAIEIDIEKMRIGHKKSVADVTSEGFEILNNSDAIIVAVKTSRNAVDDSEDEDEEGAEGEGEEATAEAAE